MADIGQEISTQVNYYLANFLDIAYKIMKIPFELWNQLPIIIHWIAAGVVVSLAILFTFALWKLREEWRFRA